jgi:myb proto-oncogene protein
LEEELALMNAHRIYGNKWAEIAKVLPGRYSCIICKNYEGNLVAMLILILCFIGN